MLNRARITSRVALVCAALLLAAASSSVFGQSPSVQSSFSSSAQEATPINVLVGQSRVINFDEYGLGDFRARAREAADGLVAADDARLDGEALGQRSRLARPQNGLLLPVSDQLAPYTM